MSVSINRQVGSTFVVIGTEVGAGILALPIVISKIGFPLGCLSMLMIWALMTYTALLVSEALLSVEDGTSYGKLAGQILGAPAEAVSWITFLTLLYVIMVAYISAAGSAFDTVLHLGNHLSSFLFVLVLGSFVIIGITAVDWLNRILLTGKLILLLFVCVLLLPDIDQMHLKLSFVNNAVIMATLPVFVTTFVSHPIIPPLRTYLKSDAKVIARVILIGSTIALCLYIIWVMCVLGVIPYTGDNSFAILKAKGSSANVGDVLNLMRANLNNEAFYAPVSIFSNISVTTSFLGISLALYYFIIDGFRLKKLPSLRKNIIASVLTFILPLFIVWFFPNVFIKALGYVGLCCTILFIIMPFFMIRKLKQKNHVFKIKYIDHKVLLWMALVCGTLLILSQVFNMLGK
jgi:tyrosine-specific transport protein